MSFLLCITLEALFFPNGKKSTEVTVLNRDLVTGDKVVIYAPAYGKALSTKVAATYYSAGKDVVVKNGVMTGA